MNNRFFSPFAMIESREQAMLMARYSVAGFGLWGVVLLVETGTCGQREFYIGIFGISVHCGDCCRSVSGAQTKPYFAGFWCSLESVRAVFVDGRADGRNANGRQWSASLGSGPFIGRSISMRDFAHRGFARDRGSVTFFLTMPPERKTCIRFCMLEGIMCR